MDRLSLKYPIYIVSKGRWENPFTAKSFKKEKIPFKVAVEPEEYDNYCKSLGEEHVARLPFSNLGVGSFPARNWCWENSRELSLEKCWPQYAKTVMRFNRPHHSVSWKKFFHQPLVRKKNYEEILNRQMRTNG